MDRGLIAFNAVFLRSGAGYLGFIEELPGVNAHGRTLEEARANLKRLAAVVFDEERQQAEALIEGKDFVRETFTVPFPPA
ncbi:MAG: type II toxin-antitoxin system HicB family antitoxin [Betaproteobacteria bacterium]|nr:type II toxin-antitoxin system HicB family antitoxin [Betaproteobacteria bacterium]